MIKLLFQVAVYLLLFILVANFISWMMPILTSPIVFTILFAFLFIIVWKLIVRSFK